MNKRLIHSTRKGVQGRCCEGARLDRLDLDITVSRALGSVINSNFYWYLVVIDSVKTFERK